MVRAYEIDLTPIEFALLSAKNYLAISRTDIAIDDYVLFRNTDNDGNISNEYRMTKINDVVKEGFREGYSLLFFTKL